MSIIVNNWRMDSSLNALIHCTTGEVRRLGEYHFILLETLVKNADAVLSRSYLMSEVWKNRVVGGNSLPTAIHALRTAIDDNGKQQEIIKTIPKKGYLFNKNYISVVDADEKINDEVTSESIQNSAVDKEKMRPGQPEENRNSVVGAPFPGVDNTVITSEKQTIKVKKYSYKTLFIALSVIIFLFVLNDYLIPLETASDAPVVIKEPMNDIDHISVYHLSSHDTNKKTTSLLSQHLQAGMLKVNQLLAQRNASMDLYYKISLSRLDINAIIKNSCNDSWQLALRFESWQNKDADMNTILFQETEKMLNEMPSCK